MSYPYNYDLLVYATTSSLDHLAPLVLVAQSLTPSLP